MHEQDSDNKTIGGTAATAAGAYTYDWYINGTKVTGSAATLTIADVVGVEAGKVELTSGYSYPVSVVAKNDADVALYTAQTTFTYAAE